MGYSNGTNSWESSNGNRTLELASVNTTGCSNMIITIRISSTSTTTGNGSDAGDFIRVFVNLNGAGYPATADITSGKDGNTRCCRWGYNAWDSVPSGNAGTVSINLSYTPHGTNTNNYSTYLK